MSDLIDREKLKEAMYYEAFEKDSNEQKWDSGCWIRYKLFERVLASIPSVQTEQENGKWINKNENSNEIFCSQCGYRSMFLLNSYWKYCPNCGAKMEEE